MHFFLALLCAIFISSTAALAESATGYAYYPSESKPEYLLKLTGTVVNGKVAVKDAFLTPKLVSGTLAVTPTGQKLGMDGTKLGSRLGLGLQVNVNQQLGFHSSAADVSVFYPSKIMAMPTVTIKAKAEILKSPCKRSTGKAKASNVEASISLPAEVSNGLTFGDPVSVGVYDDSNNLLEQATFKICPKQAYNQMLAAAIQSILNKDASGSASSQSKTDSQSPQSPTTKTDSQSSQSPTTKSDLQSPKLKIESKSEVPQTK